MICPIFQRTGWSPNRTRTFYPRTLVPTILRMSSRRTLSFGKRRSLIISRTFLILVLLRVDPLDGTLEFAENKVENTTVLIGVAVNNNAVAGVIHQPYFENSSGQLGRTIWGVKGLGIGGMEAISPPADEFTVVTTRSHSNKLVSDAIEALSPTQVVVVEVRDSKSCNCWKERRTATYLPVQGANDGTLVLRRRSWKLREGHSQISTETTTTTGRRTTTRTREESWARPSERITRMYSGESRTR